MRPADITCLFCETNNFDIVPRVGGHQLKCSNCGARGPVAETKAKAMTAYVSASPGAAPAASRRSLRKRLEAAIWNAIIQLYESEEQRYADLVQREEEDCLVNTLYMKDFPELAEKVLDELAGKNDHLDEKDRKEFEEERAEDEEEDGEED